MQAAAARRDPAPGEIHDPDHDRDVVTVLTREHDQVTALLEQLAAIPGHKQGGSAAQIQRRKAIVDMVSAALSRHESGEQQHLWPRVRKLFDDGDARADQALHQEQQASDTLTALGNAAPDSDEFDELAEKLVLQARQHVAFEDQVFLDLCAAMKDNEREKLGAKLARRQDGD